MSLCWEAYRDVREGDPTRDYYRLRVYGSFGGESGSGVRWMSVRASLADGPADHFEGWPGGLYDGPCQEIPVPFGVGVFDMAILCGRTVGTTDVDDASHTVTWTCGGCLFPDHATRGIALYERVAVQSGTVPTWEVFADLGS